jgi:type I restriction enzyme R subunit
VTSEEGQVGRGHLSKFQELETNAPVILTTSQLLTTGVDVETCKNIVLARVVNSMTEFKQIIGRGTRVRDDYGKLYFHIIDYTGSATRLFADPEFDGDPAFESESAMDEQGRTAGIEKIVRSEEIDDEAAVVAPLKTGEALERYSPRKYYFDGGQVEIAAHLVYELDPDGKQLRVVKFTDYTAEKVRTLYRSAAELRLAWADSVQRAVIIEKLEERGISFTELATTTNQPEADPFDLLCHVAFNAPLRTRRERADRLRREKKDFFEKYGPQAREILDDLLEKYAGHGPAQFEIPDVLQVPPISGRGNVLEIVGFFGGPEKLREAVSELQALLYAA